MVNQMQIELDKLYSAVGKYSYLLVKLRSYDLSIDIQDCLPIDLKDMLGSWMLNSMLSKWLHELPPCRSLWPRQQLQPSSRW